MRALILGLISFARNGAATPCPHVLLSETVLLDGSQKHLHFWADDDDLDDAAASILSKLGVTDESAVVTLSSRLRTKRDEVCPKTQDDDGDTERACKNTAAAGDSAALLRAHMLDEFGGDTRGEMAVIGLYPGHDASIAIAVGGRVQCVLELERLFDVRYFCPTYSDETRFRDEWTRALAAVRERCVCDPRPCPRAFDVGVVVGFSLFTNSGSRQMMVRHIVEDTFGGPPRAVARWRSVDHHEAHAHTAYFASPFRRALVVSYDGGGNDGAFEVYVGEYSKMARVARLDYNLGHMYRFLASFLPEVTGDAIAPAWCADYDGQTQPMSAAWKARSRATWLALAKHERPPFGMDLSWAGKLMGYSATGSARSGALLEELESLYNHSGQLRPGFGRVDKQAYIPLPYHLLAAVCSGVEGQRNAAATIQRSFENVVLGAIEAVLARTGGAERFDGVVLTGGCALNVLANQLIADRLRMRVFVPPNPGDEGLAVGGLWAAGPPPPRVASLQYLGFDLWDGDDLAAEARTRGTASLAALGGPDFLAELLASHRTGNASDGGGRCPQAIVAVVRGRQEHGPRALGHRSLIAVPDSDAIRERMNALKHRQWYRPVAPMVASEDLEAVFGHDAFTDSPYMSLAPKVKPAVRAAFPAMAHLDGTARHQSVSRDDEPWVWALLRAVGRRIGLGVLINTSFNTRGHPIVNTVRDSLKMLDELPDLDFVVIEDWLFSKPPALRKRELMCGIRNGKNSVTVS